MYKPAARHKIMSASVSQFNEDLIALVKSHPALYDPSEPGYKMEMVKQNLWIKISERLGADGKKLC